MTSTPNPIQKIPSGQGLWRSIRRFFLGTLCVMGLLVSSIDLKAPLRGDSMVSVSEVSSQELPKAKLEDLLSKPLTGLEIEYPEKKALENLTLQYKKFFDYRQTPLTPTMISEVVVECLLEPERNLFCPFLREDWNAFAKSKENLSDPSDTKWPELSLRLPLSAEDVRAALKEANLDVLKSVTRRSIYRALKDVSSFTEIEKTVDKAIEAKSCNAPELYYGLASKSEEYFPDEVIRSKAGKLYSQVVACAPSATVKIKPTPGSLEETFEDARYRLSLLQIWENKCDNAESLLEPLGVEDGRYQTRSLYWRAWCAREQGNKLAFEVLRSKLLKSNPLAYHGLILHQKGSVQLVDFISQNQTEAFLRTAIKPQLNAYVRAIELLQSQQKLDLAGEFIPPLVQQMTETEPQFKLYVAVLVKRNEWKLTLFQVLAKVFQDDPTLISEQALKLFYPLKQFEILAEHKRTVDPYFLAALIRQESAFVPTARSRVGALGLMQLMPETARRMGTSSKRQLLQPRTNVRTGVKYLSKLLTQFDGDAELALAAYNAGPHRVEDWKRRYPTDNRMLFLDLIPFSETRQYVSLIGRNYYWYLSLYAPESFEEKIRGIASSPSHKVYFTGFAQRR